MGDVKVSLSARAKIKINLGLPKVSFSETDPTVPDWAKEPSKPEYMWDEIKDTPQEIDNMEIEELIKNMGGL